MTLGFQVDRAKHAEPGEAKVRLTAYYASTGKVRGHQCGVTIDVCVLYLQDVNLYYAVVTFLYNVIFCF